MPCLRGLNAYLVMSVCQWYFPVIVDFVLSGQPDGLQLGYGSSSVVVAICFGGGAALWTHCAITERSSDYVYGHSEKGHQVLPKLVPVTAMWAFCEQLCLSLPLALSRYYGLKKYAFEPQSWNQLGKYGQLLVIYQFFIVYSLHLALVAVAYIPANMILRRVHAGMLASDETAIVPVHHSEKDVSIAEAWSTMDWSAYWRVVGIYIQQYLLDHLIHVAYWSAVWMLYQVLEIHHYQTQQLPNAPAMIEIKIF